MTSTGQFTTTSTTGTSRLQPLQHPGSPGMATAATGSPSQPLPPGTHLRRRSSVSRSISHESSTQTLAYLVHAPARLIPEYTALLVPAVHRSTKQPHHLQVRIELVQALLDRLNMMVAINDPESAHVDRCVLDDLTQEFNSFRRQYEVNNSESILLEHAKNIHNIGEKGVWTPSSTSAPDKLYIPPRVDIDEDYIGWKNRLNGHQRFALLVGGICAVLLFCFSIIGAALVGSHDTADSGTTVATVFCSMAAGVSITFPLLAYLFISSGTKQIRQRENKQLQFLNTVFQSQLSHDQGSSGSPEGTNAGEVTSTYGESSASGIVPLMRGNTPYMFQEGQPGYGPSQYQQQVLAQYQSQPGSQAGPFAAASGRGNPLARGRQGSVVVHTSHRASTGADIPPLPAFPSHQTSLILPPHPVEPTIRHRDDPHVVEDTPSVSSINETSTPREHHVTDMPPAMQLNYSYHSMSNVPLPNRQNENRRDMLFSGSTVTSGDGDQRAFDIPAPLVEVEIPHMDSSRSAASPPFTPLPLESHGRRSPSMSMRKKSPRSPTKTHSMLSTADRFGSTNNLMVPLSLPGNPASRKTSMTQMMESSLTDPQSIVQQWSNSPVGQVEVAQIDEDFLGNLEMKVPLTQDDKAKTRVRINGSALHQNMILIGVDENFNVFMWNTCAVVETGLSVQDALHKKIENFVADEFSMDMIVRMYSFLQEGRAAPICRLKLVSLINCTVSVRATATTVELHDGRSHGMAIIARTDQDIDTTNNAFLIKYRNAEILQELKNIPNVIESDVYRVAKRIESLAEHATWEYVSNVALLMTEWEPVGPDTVLYGLARGYLNKVNIVIGKNMPEQIEIDTITISGVITELVDKSSTELTMTMKHHTFSAQTSCIEINFTGVTYTSFEEIRLSKQMKRAVEAVCGTLYMVDDHHVVFRFPCSQLQHLGSSNGSSNNTPLSPSMAGMGPPSIPLTFLLYENKTIYRHNVSTQIWQKGHALCVVDGPRSTERTIRSGLRDIHAAIVDLDGTRSSTGIINFLKQYPNIVVFTCSEDEAPPNFNRKKHHRKPITRGALTAIIEEVADIVAKQQEKEHEIEKQRKIFNEQRRSPVVIGKRLGHGAFADVYEAKGELNNAVMAVKKIWYNSADDEDKQRIKKLINEIEVMISLTHPNIVHYFYCEKGEKSVDLFMELCEGGNLAQFIKANAPLPAYQVSNMIAQLVRAVVYLHELKVMHRDIKPANILLTKEGKVKLTDFGTAVKVDKNKLVKETEGTLRWMAPEVLNAEEQTPAVDIWPIGIIACELLGVSIPFLEKYRSFPALMHYFEVLGEKGGEVELPNLPGEAQSFVSDCLKYKPEDRPKATSLLIHPFLSETLQVTSVPTYRRLSNAAPLQGMPHVRRMSRLPQVPELIEPSSSSDSHKHPDDVGDGVGMMMVSPKSQSVAPDNASVVSDIILGPTNRTPPSGTYVFPTEAETPRASQATNEPKSAQLSGRPSCEPSPRRSPGGSSPTH